MAADILTEARAWGARQSHGNQRMFALMRYVIAKNHVLMAMEYDGLISKDEVETMRVVAGHPVNASYGAQAIKTRAAVNKYAAAAAVFARLSAAAARNPDGDISADVWANAARVAMMRAGCTRDESEIAAKELIAMH